MGVEEGDLGEERNRCGRRRRTRGQAGWEWGEGDEEEDEGLRKGRRRDKMDGWMFKQGAGDTGSLKQRRFSEERSLRSNTGGEPYEEYEAGPLVVSAEEDR